ncbi:MAG: hypothetical protein M1457_10905 [bacterium]|nr:hypothetical protein [bacterium]
MTNIHYHGREATDGPLAAVTAIDGGAVAASPSGLFGAPGLAGGAPSAGSGRLLRRVFAGLNETPLKFYYLFIAFWAVFFIVNYRDCLLWDNARQLYAVLRNGASGIPSHRYTRYFLESIAVILARLGFSTNAVAIGYLLGYCLYYLTIMTFLLHVLKRRDLAFGLLLYVIAGMVHGAIYPWDAGHSVALLFPLVGILENAKPWPAWATVVGCVLCPVTAFFLHPASLVVMPFAVGYVHILRGRKYDVEYAFVLAGIVVAFVAGKLIYSDYEAGRTATLGYLMSREWAYYNARFVVRNHFAVLLVAATILLASIPNRMKLLAVFIAAYIAGYLYLACVIYTPVIQAWVYAWHGLGPAYALAIIPLVDGRAFGSRPWIRWSPYVLLAVLGACAWYGITHDLAYMRERRYIMLDILAARPDMEHRSFYIDETGCWDIMTMRMGIETESILQSAFRDPALGRQIQVARYSRGPGAIALNTSAPAAAIRQQVEDHVTLYYPDLPCRRYLDRDCLPVTIVNNGPRPLPSRATNGKPVMINYEWTVKGKPVARGAYPLRIDVVNTYKQDLYPPHAIRPPDARLSVNLTLGGDRLASYREVATATAPWQERRLGAQRYEARVSGDYLDEVFNKIGHTFAGASAVPRYATKPMANPGQPQTPRLIISVPKPVNGTLHYLPDRDFYLMGAILMDEVQPLVVTLDGRPVPVRYIPRPDLATFSAAHITGVVIRIPKEMLRKPRKLIFTAGGNRLDLYRLMAAD